MGEVKSQRYSTEYEPLLNHSTSGIYSDAIMAHVLTDLNQDILKLFHLLNF